MTFFIVLIVAMLSLVAFIWARDAMRRAGELEKSVARLAARLDALAGAGAPPSSPGASGASAPPAAAPGTPSTTGSPAAAPLRPEAPSETETPRPGHAAPPIPPAPVSASAPVPAPAPAGAAPGKPSLEERLGARLTVWLGAIAIALAGALLVKYSFDQGWVGPGVRVTLGALLGIVALGLGEWLRARAAAIGAGLSAAGIAVLYASTLAAGELYAFIPPAAAFALMALVTATAVALSLRQGPIIAAVGLIGGFATPLLIETDGASAGRLFAYLLLVELGLLVVSDRRAWWGIGAAAIAASLAWVLLWIGTEPSATDGPILLTFLLGSGAAFLGAASRSADGARPAPPWLAWAAAGGVLVAAGAVLSAGGYRTLDWAMVGLLGAGTIAAGRLNQAWDRMPWLASALGALLLLGAADWGGIGPIRWPLTGGVAAPTLSSSEAERLRLLTAAALGALYVAGGYGVLWGARRPWMWAGLSGASAVMYFLAAYLPSTDHAYVLRWGAWALVLAAAGIAAAWPVARRAAGLPHAAETLAALAAAISTLVALAVPIELAREWIGVAWAIEAALLVWIARRLNVPALRRLVWPLGALVAARLLVNPAVLQYPVGRTPIFNWLLYGYGIPILAFGAAAWRAGQDGDRRLAEALGWLSAALGLWLISLEVHHLFSPGDLGRPVRTFAEGTSYPWVWSAYGLALLRAHRRWPDRVLLRAGIVVAALGAVAFVLGPLLSLNPLVGRGAFGLVQRVGEWPVLNWLVPAYGVPAALFIGLGVEARRIGLPRWSRAVLAGAAMLAGFAFLSFEIRQLFQGSELTLAGRDTTFAERSTYSIAWIVYSAALLGIGIKGGWRSARYGALVVMSIAVVKVFLVDIGTLGGLYRVGSFLGLGASLLVIAWLYTRFVVGRPAE